MTLFDTLPWRDPVSRKRLIPKITLRDPWGRPYCGAMQIEGEDRGYPIVNGILRATPELAFKYKDWLLSLALKPPCEDVGQDVQSTRSFGFQWAWDSQPRTAEDLLWRAATRFNINPGHFKEKLLLDAGCGAGDQSNFFLSNGASVVSVDLSDAIEVAAKKMQGNARWVGIQADISMLPFEREVFDFVYCEGVIQHTEDSLKVVKELSRVLKIGGDVAATHYGLPSKWHQKIRHLIKLKRRKKFSRWDPYRLLAYSGMLALIAEIPLVGHVLRKSSFVVSNSRMPDLKSTWSCTYDYFGSHSFQRHVSREVFRQYWDKAGSFEKIFVPQREMLVYLRKKG